MNHLRNMRDMHIICKTRQKSCQKKEIRVMFWVDLKISPQIGLVNPKVFSQYVLNPHCTHHPDYLQHMYQISTVYTRERLYYGYTATCEMTQEVNCLTCQTIDLELENTCMLAQEGIPHVNVREGNMTARHADSQVGLRDHLCIQCLCNCIVFL